MMTGELDETLSRQDEIMPSSGFVASVMEAVHQEAEMTGSFSPIPFPPIPFPWIRAIPVFVALAAVLTMLIAWTVELARMPHSAAQAWKMPPSLQSVLGDGLQANAGWIALALLLTLFSVIFSLRLASEKR